MEAISPPDSDCSPSNLDTQTMTLTTVYLLKGAKNVQPQKHKKSNLRDCVLSEGQILDKNIQTLIFFVQELPYPPARRRGDRVNNNSNTGGSNNDKSSEEEEKDEEEE